MNPPRLGTLVLKRDYTLPDAKSYRAVFGYVRQGPGILAWVYCDAEGRQRVLSVHRDDVVRFQEDAVPPNRPYAGIFDATKFKPKQREGEDHAS